VVWMPLRVWLCDPVLTSKKMRARSSLRPQLLRMLSLWRTFLMVPNLLGKIALLHLRAAHFCGGRRREVH
jgi:hypothetical protein